MSEDTTTPATSAETADTTDWKAEAEKWKGHARTWEKRAEDNKTAADKLADLENANKSDTERLTERATAAEKRAAEAELRLMRAEVAAEKGLTPAQAKRLSGTTKDELTADADDLVSAFGTAKPADQVSDQRPPREDLRPGAANTDDTDDNVSSLADEILARGI